MLIHLAPMEGVIDQPMRALLTSLGGYSHCVTEFIRVVNQRLPARVFHRYCPELRQGGRTASGTPVVVQLLGGIAETMAENAERAVSLGALGIDINFGCPSRFVNRSEGGAVLLKEPERIYEITRAVRMAVPAAIPVSAKIRLGFENTDLALANADAVESAGASYITIHARTKADGYRHPARWEWLAHLSEQLTIPMIANGDITSVDDYRRCREISGCNNIMLGRGALACPDLAQQIRAVQQSSQFEPARWDEILALVIKFSHALKHSDTSGGRYITARIKQWLGFLKGHYSEAQHCFNDLRTMRESGEIITRLQWYQSHPILRQHSVS